jgi:hypothetical protein
MITSNNAVDEADNLVDVRDYHYDGEDLSKLPRIIDLNDTAPNVGPIWQELCLVPMHLDSVR